MSGKANAGTGKARHPIGVVSERTGLTPDLLRAWESRYGVVEPERSEGGHRLYSDAQVERLRLLHELTRAGRSIGQVAGMETPALARLVREDAEARANVPGGASPDSEGSAEAYVRQALEAIDALDAVTLDRVVRRGALALGTVPYLERVAAPVLREVGDRWYAGDLSPAHEHMASVGIRRVLDWLIQSGRRGRDAPRIVVSTPAGDRHEMGALLATAAAESVGWEPVYLGPDLPADDIARSAVQTGARAVALGAAFAPDRGRLVAEVLDLRSRLAPSVSLIVGGSAFAGLEEELRDERVVVLPDLASMVRVLDGLAPGFR